MGRLLWQCADGVEMRSDTAGVKLVVAPAPVGGGFRYQLLGDGEIFRGQILASGYRGHLRDALDAAERRALSFATPVSDG